MRDVSKSYGSVRVLSGLDLQIHKGEIVGLQGENGAGKSTVLNLIAGLSEVDRGTVSVFGSAPGRAKIGYIWQEARASLYPWLSGWENAALALTVTGAAKRERKQRVEDLMDRLSWDLPLQRKPHQMSGGQQQRICILRALVDEPDLVLIDEGFSDQDRLSKLRLLFDLQGLAKNNGMTVLFTSHALEETVFLADRSVCLRGQPAHIPSSGNVSISCPHPRPRPLSWSSEPSFDAALLEVRHSLSSTWEPIPSN